MIVEVTMRWIFPILLFVCVSSLSTTAQAANSKLEKMLDFLKARVLGRTVSPEEAVTAIIGQKDHLQKVEYDRTLTFTLPSEIKGKNGEVTAVVFSTKEKITRTITPVDDKGNKKPKAKIRKVPQTVEHRYEFLQGITPNKEEFVHGFIQTVEDSEGEVGDTMGFTATQDEKGVHIEGDLNFDENTKVTAEGEETFPISTATKIDLQPDSDNRLVMDQTFLVSSLEDISGDESVFEAVPFTSIVNDPKEGPKEVPMTPVLLHSTEDVEE
jgi:hypothetical protein